VCAKPFSSSTSSGRPAAAIPGGAASIPANSILFCVKNRTATTESELCQSRLKFFFDVGASNYYVFVFPLQVEIKTDGFYLNVTARVVQTPNNRKKEQ
jgi:hypothetical protein